MLIGLDTVSIGEPSARLADPSSGPATAAQEWGDSVIESGEFPVIVTNISERGCAGYVIGHTQAVGGHEILHGDGQITGR